MFRNRRGDISIDQIILFAIVLILLIVMLIALGSFRESASRLLAKIMGFFSGP